MSRLLGLDGVRAVACWLVVFHHAVQMLGVQASTDFLTELQKMFLFSAPAGVSVFFVLSGMLLSYPFWSRYLSKQGMPSLKEYAVRRGARIMPAFYLVLTLSLLLEAFVAPDIPGRLRRYVTAVSFTAGFHYTTFFPTVVNGPLWSISFEVISYVLLPVFMCGLFFVGRQRKFGIALGYWLGIFVIIFIINSLIQTYFQPDDINRGWQYGLVGGAKYWMPNYNPIGFFAHYLMGIFAAGFMAWFGKNYILRRKLEKFYFFDFVSTVGLLGVIAILWTQRMTPDFSFSWQNQPFYYPLFAFSVGMVLAVVPYSKIIGHILDNPISCYTAKISFGIYIWHFLVMMVVLAVVSPNHTPMPINDYWLWAKVMGMVVIITYAIASLSWYFIEKPILDLAHCKFSSKKIPQGRIGQQTIKAGHSN